MTNRHTSHLIGEFLDGELSPKKHQEVLDHFSRCPSCAKEMKQYQQLKSILNRVESTEPGEGYFEALSENILTRTEHIYPVSKLDSNVRRQSLTRQNIFKMLIRVAAVITLLFISLFATEFKPRKHVSQTGGRAQEIRSDGKNIAGWKGSHPQGSIEGKEYKDDTSDALRNR